MSRTYYYLVASLPYLDFQNPSPIGREAFLSECKKWLYDADFTALQSIDMHDLETRPTDPEIIRKWNAHNRIFREELAAIRKAKKESAGTKIPDSFRNIFNEPTPLMIERRIAREMWNFLEENEFGHHFDLEVLMLYFLRLQILERLGTFEPEEGKTVFGRLCETHYG